MGYALQSLGQLAEAEQAYRHALSCRAEDADAWCNLGMVLNDLGRLAEAQDCYEQALRLQPESVTAYNNLGVTLSMAGKFEPALACLRRSIEINPQLAQSHCNLGLRLHEMGLLTAAEQSIRRALALNPEFAVAHSSLGNVLKDWGRLDEAQACYRQALLLKPDFVNAYTNLLFTLNYQPDLSAEQIFAEYRGFESTQCLSFKKDWRAHGNHRALDRRLKVGYVAATFFNHSCRYFLEPLLARHDKSAVEVYLYAQQTRTDALTERYQRYADHWLPTVGLSDAALAERIRADGIDVLIDIAGHTRNNRLLVFARKPASNSQFIN
ncbi:MAG: tetratricopeptide repeat protein [Rhodoferax sp.]|nr:tetratricopeptide repeat protein [Rhodoferax sp.]